jgi:hypothetical protein
MPDDNEDDEGDEEDEAGVAFANAMRRSRPHTLVASSYTSSLRPHTLVA